MGAFLSLIDPVAKIIERVIPDKAASDAAKAQLLQSEISGDFQNALAQIQDNATEAANSHVFVSGWRPFVGWACGFAFVYAFIVQPFAQLGLVVFHAHFDPALLPKLDLSEMMPVLLGMLGLGAMRSFDKTQGTSNGH